MGSGLIQENNWSVPHLAVNVSDLSGQLLIFIYVTNNISK